MERAITGMLLPGMPAAFKNHITGQPKQSSTARCLMSMTLVKAAEFQNTLRGAENAMRKVQEQRQKSVDEYSKNVLKQNDQLRKQVAQASTAAQTAATQAAKASQGMADSQSLAAMGQSPNPPPAAQPPYGQMAVLGGPGAEGQSDTGSTPKLQTSSLGKMPSTPG